MSQTVYDTYYKSVISLKDQRDAKAQWLIEVLARREPQTPTRWALLRGTVFWPSKMFVIIVVIALVVQTLFNLLWVFVLEENDIAVPDQLILNVFTIAISFIIGQQLNESVSIYRNNRNRWGTFLTKIGNVAFQISAAYNPAHSNGKSAQERTRIFSLLTDVRDILIAMPYASRTYFRDIKAFDVGTLIKNPQIVQEAQEKMLYRDDGTALIPMLRLLIGMLFDKHQTLSELGALSHADMLQLRTLSDALGDVEAARTIQILPAVRYHIYVSLVLFFIMLSFFLFPFYRWNSLWIFALYILVFAGFFVVSLFTRNPFEDPASNSFLTTVDYLDDADRTAAGIYVAFRDNVYRHFGSIDTSTWTTDTPQNTGDETPLVTYRNGDTDVPLAIKEE